VELRTNHRSSPAVVNVSGAALPDGSAPQPALTRSPADAPRVVACRDAEHEIAVIAEQLWRARDRGVPWRQQAVLVRTNAQVAVLVDGLGHRGVPSARTGSGPRAALQQLPVLAPHASWGELLEELTDPVLMAMVEEYSALDDRPSPAAFTRWLATATADEGVAVDAVRVGTFHRAKGREWRCVVVAGVEDGFVPATAVRLDEERRLFYVAMSRATETLLCTWAARRVVRGVDSERRPSPFLAAVEVACRQAVQDQLPQPMPDGFARPRPGSANLHGGAGSLASAAAARRQRRLEALQQWRARQARAAAVAPQAVLDDATLNALADDPPPDDDGLAARSGVGPLRARRFGPALLRVLRD
jgi:DNA helicase-2/ATP-dependent DNA helicase PcrA